MLNRRAFMHILVTAAAAYPTVSLAAKRKQKSTQAKYKDPWLTLSIVQEHLFPAEKNSPGAEDIQALTYLRNMMQTPGFDQTKAELIQNGVEWLNDFSMQQHSKKFILLDTVAKEKILRAIETSRPGERWLSTLLTYLIEALLSDPVYGGNPNGIGWQWLQHQPGFPQPSDDKKYYKLGLTANRGVSDRNNRYRKTKA